MAEKCHYYIYTQYTITSDEDTLSPALHEGSTVKYATVSYMLFGFNNLALMKIIFDEVTFLVYTI